MVTWEDEIRGRNRSDRISSVGRIVGQSVGSRLVGSYLFNTTPSSLETSYSSRVSSPLAISAFFPSLQGQRDRSRYVVSQSVGNGRACGVTENRESCSNGPCARDCEYGFWSAWSSLPRAAAPRPAPAPVRSRWRDPSAASAATSDRCRSQSPAPSSPATWIAG